jgi:4-hydroxybenzoate polyprenyltransferase
LTDKLPNKTDVWDYVFVTRPILLVPVWVFLLLGYYRAGGPRFFVSGYFIYTLVCYSLLLAALYILNQIFDVRSDAINRKHLVIAEGFMPKKGAYTCAFVLLAVALIMMLRLPLLMIMFFLFSLLCGTLYSLPPVRLKARPIVDFTVNAVGYGFFNFSLGWLTRRPFSADTVIFSLPYVFAVGAIFINTTILDIDGDARSGFCTTGIFLGKNKALLLSTLLISGCVVLSAVTGDLICLIPSVLALPLFIIAAVRRDIDPVARSIRIGGPLLILMTGFVFPYFLVVFILVLLFLRVYYRKRFNISYPDLNTGDRMS